MRAPLLTGVELPALSLGGAVRAGPCGPLERVRRAAVTAEELGFATVWLADQPEGRSGGADRRTEVFSESGVVAASLAPATATCHLGLVAGDGAGRHPAMVAREVTALDHVSGGRSAVLVRYPGRAAEVAALCHRLFSGAPTSVEGTAYHTRAASSRPAPVQSGGPVLVAGVEPEEIGSGLVAYVDAVCVTGGTMQVREATAAVAAASADADLAAPDRPAVVWVGTLPADRSAVASTVAGLRDQGAEGFIGRVESLDEHSAGLLATWAAVLVGSHR